MEIFKGDGTTEIFGLVYMSDSKNKNFNTVRYFEDEAIKYIKSFGYNILRYDRLTDGCSSQFWCWGTFQHLENMPRDLQIPVINFHRYERYQGEKKIRCFGFTHKKKNEAECTAKQSFRK